MCVPFFGHQHTVLCKIAGRVHAVLILAHATRLLGYFASLVGDECCKALGVLTHCFCCLLQPPVHRAGGKPMQQLMSTLVSCVQVTSGMS